MMVMPEQINEIFGRWHDAQMRTRWRGRSMSPGKQAHRKSKATYELQ